MYSLKRVFSLLALILLLGYFAVAGPVPSTLLAQGRVDDAIVSLQGQLNSAPNDGESHLLLCRAYFDMGKWDVGIDACQKAVSLDAGNSRYHMWLGRIYGEKAENSNFLTAGRLAKKVREEFETAVRLDPKSAEARTDLAEFYIEAPGIMGGGKDKAAQQAQQLARFDPVKAAWVYARIAEKQGDFAAAEKTYRSAASGNSGQAEAWVNLARFYRNRGRFDEMAEAIQQLNAGATGKPEELVNAAQVVIRSGQHTALAAQLLRRYLSSSPTVEEAPVFKVHYLLGTLLEQQGDRQGAAQEYRAALALARNFSPAQNALDRVSRQPAGL